MIVNSNTEVDNVDSYLEHNQNSRSKVEEDKSSFVIEVMGLKEEIENIKKISKKNKKNLKEILNILSKNEEQKSFFYYTMVMMSLIGTFAGILGFIYTILNDAETDFWENKFVK